VSKVFHSLPQVQNHLSSLRGDQPQSGQRMREPEESSVESLSSRSKTVDEFETQFTWVKVFLLFSCSGNQPTCLRLGANHGCGTPGGYAPFEVSQGVTCPSSAARRTSSGESGVNGSPGRTLRARRKFSKP